MAWLLGLLVALLFLLLFLLLRPRAESKEYYDRFASLRPPGAEPPTPSQEKPEGFWSRLARHFTGERPSTTPRDWQEEASADQEPRASWQTRIRQRLQSLLQASAQEGAAAPAQRPARARSASPTRRPLFVALVAVLAVALLVSLYIERYIPSARPHRLTVVLTDLAADERMLPSSAGSQASEELLNALREAVAAEEPELAQLIVWRLAHETPAGAYAAHNLARQARADLLLWGRMPADGSSSYPLHLVINPRYDRQVPEFEEYLQVMMTPIDFSLAEADAGAGVSREALAEALVWLSHFYLGQFEQLETRPPEAIGSPELSSDLFVFHWAALQWLEGRYPQARDSYDQLLQPRYVEAVGQSAGPTGTVLPPCQETSAPELCAAASNNKAVVLLTEETLGELLPPALNEAIDLLERAQGQSSSSAVLRYNLGRVYLARNRYGEAVEVLQGLAEQDPEHAAGLAALSEAYRGSGDVGQAREWADRAVSEDRSLADGYLALGRCLLDSGETGRASHVLDRALSLAEAEGRRRRSRETALREGPRPNPRRADYTAAWADRNNIALARAHLAQARLYLLVGRTEGRPSLIVDLWRSLTRQAGPLDHALSQVTAALAEHPDWYEAYYLQGEIYLERGETDQAIDSFHTARELDTGNVQAYLGLADAYRRQWRALESAGRSEEAQEKLEQARQQYRALVERGIDPARGYFGLGEIAWEIGDVEAAMEAFLQTVEADPNYADAYLWLGRAELALADEETALAYFDQAIQTAGGRFWVLVSAHTERGQILLEQYLRSKRSPPGDPDLLASARAEFEQGGGILPALNGLGRVLYEEGNHSEAERLFEQVLRQDSNNVGALYGLGRVYEAQERSRPARDRFRRATELLPGSIAAHYHLGVAYYAQLQEHDARRAFQRTQQLCQEQAELERRGADDLESCEQVESWLRRLDVEEPTPLPTEAEAVEEPTAAPPDQESTEEPPPPDDGAVEEPALTPAEQGTPGDSYAP